jgi:hypothetical protein
MIARVLGMGDLQTAITPATPEGARSLMAASLKLSQNGYDRLVERLDEVRRFSGTAAQRLNHEASQYRKRASATSIFDGDLYLDALNLVQRWNKVVTTVAITDQDDTPLCTECGKDPIELGELEEYQLCGHCLRERNLNIIRTAARRSGFDLDKDK